MIPYYLREIPGNKFNSSEETPVFWHHANPDVGLFAFMYGLGGIIDGKDALNIISGICRNIEQRTELNEGKEDLLKKLVKDAEEWLLIGGGRRDRSPGLKAMIDLAWLEKESGYFVKVGAGKIYSLYNDGRVFAFEDDNPACLGLREDISVKMQDLSDYNGLLFVPPDLFKRVTEKEVNKIFGKNDGRQPLEKLIELEKKIFEPESALLDKYSSEELIGMLRLYGRDSFIPEEKEMLAGVVATVSAQTPELRERILSDLGVGHISLLYVDLEDVEGKARAKLQAESTERMERILAVEGEKSSAIAAKMMAEAGERTVIQGAEAAKKRMGELEDKQQKIYSALGLKEVENAEEVVLRAIEYAKEREEGLRKQLGEAERRENERDSLLERKENELRDILNQYTLLEGRHQRLTGDYASLQRHKGSIREKYEAILATAGKEKEQIEKRLGEEIERYNRLVGVVREETAQREAYQADNCRLEGLLAEGAEKLAREGGEKEGLQSALSSVQEDLDKLRGEYDSLQGKYTEMQTVNAAFEGLREEAERRGKKIAEILSDYDQLKETAEKGREQLEEAARQILLARGEKEKYQKKADGAERRLRELTGQAIRQGEVIGGLKEIVRIYKQAVEGLREEASSRGEEMARLYAEIENHKAGEEEGKKPGKEPLWIEFSSEGLARIMAIADKYGVGK